MRIPKFIKHYCWWLPCCLYSVDANAWGLVTHLYFAQSLLWAMPLLDTRLQRAIKNFPELVMAGACLPDLAIVSPHYRHTHLWAHGHQLMKSARTEEETAIAIGYISHLYIDVVAHNHFVPAHEAMWHKNEVFTHITSEWAMDGHLAPLMNTSAKQLLSKHQTVIAAFISIQFECPVHVTTKALKRLAFWDGLLRAVRLPTLIYKTVQVIDKRVFKHFVYYVAKTQVAVADIGEVLNGKNPLLEPELKNLSVDQLNVWREQCLKHLYIVHSTPIQYYQKTLVEDVFH
jgi:hypothetical protein